jgi:mevalonate pyrophosphate decarboxylase
MKTTDCKSLKQVWEMKDNAYKAFLLSGKDYINYLNDSTKDIIKQYNIKFREEIIEVN